MKKVLTLIGFIGILYTSNAQISSYYDLGILFTQENAAGTARYNAMGGAFGALGGDLNAVMINPAGGAIFINNQASITLGYQNKKLNSSFYNNSFSNNEGFLDLDQGGVHFQMETGSSDWKKVSFTFNYAYLNDFEEEIYFSGNSGFAPITDFYDPNVEYGNLEGQDFTSYIDGKNNKYNIAISTAYKDKLFLGLALNTNDISYRQASFNREFNNDEVIGSTEDINYFDIQASQELNTFGNGISFGFGAIYKPSQQFNIGFSYQTPTWYTLSEQYWTYDDLLIYNGSRESASNYSYSEFEYNLRTPSKFTGSLAYIFGKHGLISGDITYQDYGNIKLKNSGTFSQENTDLKATLNSILTYKLGTEWRLKNLSFRGGYQFQENPYRNNPNSSELSTYSFGLGYNFGSFKLDASCQIQESYSSSLNAYSGSEYEGYTIDNATLDKEKYRIGLTGTYVF